MLFGANSFYYGDDSSVATLNNTNGYIKANVAMSNINTLTNLGTGFNLLLKDATNKNNGDIGNFVMTGTASTAGSLVASFDFTDAVATWGKAVTKGTFTLEDFIDSGAGHVVNANGADLVIAGGNTLGTTATYRGKDVYITGKDNLGADYVFKGLVTANGTAGGGTTQALSTGTVNVNSSAEFQQGVWGNLSVADAQDALFTTAATDFTGKTLKTTGTGTITNAGGHTMTLTGANLTGVQDGSLYNFTKVGGVVTNGTIALDTGVGFTTAQNQAVIDNLARSLNNETMGTVTATKNLVANNFNFSNTGDGRLVLGQNGDNATWTGNFDVGGADIHVADTTGLTTFAGAKQTIDANYFLALGNTVIGNGVGSTTATANLDVATGKNLTVAAKSTWDLSGLNYGDSTGGLMTGTVVNQGTFLMDGLTTFDYNATAGSTGTTGTTFARHFDNQLGTIEAVGLNFDRGLDLLIDDGPGVAPAGAAGSKTYGKINVGTVGLADADMTRNVDLTRFAAGTTAANAPIFTINGDQTAASTGFLVDAGKGQLVTNSAAVYNNLQGANGIVLNTVAGGSTYNGTVNSNGAGKNIDILGTGLATFGKNANVSSLQDVNIAPESVFNGSLTAARNINATEYITTNGVTTALAANYQQGGTYTHALNVPVINLGNTTNADAVTLTSAGGTIATPTVIKDAVGSTVKNNLQFVEGAAGAKNTINTGLSTTTPPGLVNASGVNVLIDSGVTEVTGTGTFSGGNTTQSGGTFTQTAANTVVLNKLTGTAGTMSGVAGSKTNVTTDVDLSGTQVWSPDQSTIGGHLYVSDTAVAGTDADPYGANVFTVNNSLDTTGAPAVQVTDTGTIYGDTLDVTTGDVVVEDNGLIKVRNVNVIDGNLVLDDVSNLTADILNVSGTTTVASGATLNVGSATFNNDFTLYGTGSIGQVTMNDGNYIVANNSTLNINPGTNNWIYFNDGFSPVGDHFVNNGTLNLVGCLSLNQRTPLQAYAHDFTVGTINVFAYNPATWIYTNGAMKFSADTKVNFTEQFQTHYFNTYLNGVDDPAVAGPGNSHVIFNAQNGFQGENFLPEEFSSVYGTWSMDARNWSDTLGDLGLKTNGLYQIYNYNRTNLNDINDVSRQLGVIGYESVPQNWDTVGVIQQMAQDFNNTGSYNATWGNNGVAEEQGAAWTNTGIFQSIINGTNQFNLLDGFGNVLSGTFDTRNLDSILAASSVNNVVYANQKAGWENLDTLGDVNFYNTKLFNQVAVMNTSACDSSDILNQNYFNRFWVRGMGYNDDASNRDGFSGYKYDPRGFMLGYDRAFCGGVIAGVSFAYTKGDYEDAFATGHDSQIKNYSFNGYLTWNHTSGFFTSLLGGYTRSNNDINEFYGRYNRGVWAREDYDGDTWYILGKMGYNIRPAANFMITPSVGLGYINTRDSGHSVAINGYDLFSYDRVKHGSGFIPVEVRAGYDIPVGCDSAINLTGKVGYTYNFNGDAATGSMRVLGLADAAANPMVFGATGREYSHHVFNIGAGVGFTYKGFNISADYQYYKRKGLDAHRVGINAGIGF